MQVIFIPTLPHKNISTKIKVSFGFSEIDNFFSIPFGLIDNSQQGEKLRKNQF